MENASLLPWLTGTAYLHSVMVQERRGMLRVWNLSLVCATFALTILGTFLTRSGLVDSVHAFSADAVGPALLVFFALVVVVTVGLIAWRGDRLRSTGQIDSSLSREASFLANNLLFGVFAFVVLLGTVFPLIVEAVGGERISVGTPFFDRMTMPVGLLLLFLMAVAPVLPWRKTTAERLSERLMWPGWAAVAGLLIALLVGARGLAPLLAFGLAGFAGGAAVRQLVLATRRQGWRGLVGRANGGMVVHIGVVVVAVALAASNSYLHQSEFTVEPGETAYVNGHEIVFLGSQEKVFDNKTKVEALVLVDGAVVAAGGEPVCQRRRGAHARNQIVANSRHPSGGIGPARRARWSRRVAGDRAAADPVAVDRRRDHAVGRGVLGVSRPPPLAHPAGVGAGAGSCPAKRVPSRWRSARCLSRRRPLTIRSNPTSQTSLRGLRTVRWVVLAVGLLAVALVVVLAVSERDRRGPPVPDFAPEFAGETLDGGGFDMAAQRGRWVVVNFFSTWCVQCVVEHPELVAFHDRYRGDPDIRLVSVVFQDEVDVITQFFCRAGRRLAGGDHQHRPDRDDFGVTAVPETYLVDPLGRVVAKFTGGVTLAGLETQLVRAGAVT